VPRNDTNQGTGMASPAGRAAPAWPAEGGTSATDQVPVTRKTLVSWTAIATAKVSPEHGEKAGQGLRHDLTVAGAARPWSCH